MDSDVTVVITSCGRQDLLEVTMDSFLEFNSYPIRHYFITEDSGIPGINDKLKRKYSALPITWIESGEQRGQLACLDDAYSRLETKYIFHCQDDWEFYRGGFIEQSKPILENCHGALQVLIRAEYDTGGHPLDAEVYVLATETGEIRFRRYSYNYLDRYHGFSWNPGLRRLSDYRALGKYAPYKHEAEVGMAYKLRLYSAVILCGKGYVRHIGDGRHVVDPVREKAWKPSRVYQRIADLSWKLYRAPRHKMFTR
jgi:hypothetical protein